MRGLEREYSGRITFVRVNILNEENLPIMQQYGFSASPELYLVDESGQILAFFDDSFTQDALRAAFDQALATP